MNAKLLILFSLFFTSLAFAHPNHMSFEDVRHDLNSMSISVDSANTVIPIREEKHGHKELVPCTEQHREVPCKRKQ